jgi:hypothetical protein
VRGTIDLAGKVGQWIALGIDVGPKRPQPSAAHAFAAPGCIARFVLRDILWVKIVRRHIRIIPRIDLVRI